MIRQDETRVEKKTQHNTKKYNVTQQKLKDKKR